MSGDNREVGCEVLPHHPYSLHTAPSNYQLFKTLKFHMMGWYYENDMAVLEATCRWLQNDKMDFMTAY
jgi:hypothetical protein